jgi:YVTN family beta-propeller protein
MTNSRKAGAARIVPAFITLVIAISTGCDSSDPDTNVADAEAVVLVANQGNFADGNGSITQYDPATGEVVTLLSEPNSIIQSMDVDGGLLYITMNTGDRVDVIDVERGLVGQVVDVPSPRYMAWADAARLLVSNLYDNAVSILDVPSSMVVSRVDVGPNPEGIAVYAGMAYVANHGFGAGKTVTVIDTATGEVARTLHVDCDGPRFVHFDHEGDMWTSCTGQTLYDQDFNVTGTTNGAVLIVDPNSGATRSRFDLQGMAVTAGPGQDTYLSREADALFVVVGGDRIVRFDTARNELVSEIGPLSGALIGAIAFDAAAQRIYVGRVPGFAQAGEVTIMETDGAVVGQFKAGVAPSHIEVLRRAGAGL